MKKSILRKYAKLIAVTGANVQKDQPVIIYANLDQPEFVSMVVEECYKKGAKYVRVEWNHDPLIKLNYKYQNIETLKNVPKWNIEKLKLMVDELPCRIHIISDDPDGLKGIDIEKMQLSKIARYKKTKKYSDAIESKHQWTIAAVPSVAWAKKVYPELSKAKAVEKLWETILSTVHITADNDPVAAWDEHNKNFTERCEWLNSMKFDKITYKSKSGTDFSCELIKEGRWCGGGETTKSGVYFNPNMPTEEIFTSPMAGKCEGKLVSTKPLCYQGQIIDGFWISFKNGKANEWDAKVGKELLGKMLTMDEGAGMLGELALVPKNGPIDRCGILFYETLFDENACCHVAVGRGFNDCIDGYLDMEDVNEECKKLGINDSMIHTDFMIGADDLAITGYKNGKATPIFVNGTWAK